MRGFGIYFQSVANICVRGKIQERISLRKNHFKYSSTLGNCFSNMAETNVINENMAEIAEKLANLNAYPCELLIPKSQTQQTKLLERNASYDGRGIVMAILDTGIDPALPGLQLTTTGERKIIDCVDCSGAGDVDTTVIRTPVDGIIIGLTGRKLRIPAEWENPSNKYHIGFKPIQELYPSKLRTIINVENGTHVWTPMHQITLADSQRLLRDHEEAVGGTSDKMSEKYEREDLACRVDYLTNASSVQEKGPIADCLVWHDGKKWKACLDTSFRGRLKLCTPMGNFRESGEYSFLTDRDKATYSFRIGPNGNHLEIVCSSGSHGSHVAGIAAANFPDNPKLNGLAPGAKIVSFMIGDNRVDSGETGTALIRAFSKCADYGVHILNMSYGESVGIPDRGRVIEELQYLVSKYNVICCISAGNSGPGLSSVGSPGGTTSYVLGIGACLFPSMVDSLYGVVADVKAPMPFIWCSRGPAADGDLGVSICAPGAAIAEVPKYDRKSSQRMNGTSMSSPNAAGAIACLLSALKTNDIKWSYLQVRLALENTAAKMDGADKFSQGNGILQIDDAFNFISKHGQFLPETLIAFKINCGSEDRGIYIRDIFRKYFQVQISCVFSPLSDLDPMINFTKNFFLTCDCSWVKTPKMFRLTSKQEDFRIEVAWEKLEPGSVNYTEICAIDPENPEIGPFFRVPITVIVPLIPDEDTAVSFSFKAFQGIPVRNFVKVPFGATLMDLALTTSSKKPEDKIMFDCTQLVRETCVNTTSNRFVLKAEARSEQTVRVYGTKTIEICATPPWGVRDEPIEGTVSIKFRGASLHSPFVMHHNSVTKVLSGEVAFRETDIQPKVQYLAYYESIKRATPYKIGPLGPQDILQSGIQINRLLLTYRYKVTKTAQFVFEFLGLCNSLYESFLDCIRFQVYTTNKEYIGSTGFYPARNKLKLVPGEYIILAQICHPQVSVLENLRDINLSVGIILPSPIVQDFYHHASGGATGKETKIEVIKGQRDFLVSTSFLSNEKLKAISPKPGSFLIGYVSIFKDKIDKEPAYYFFGDYNTKSSTGLSKVMITSKSSVPSEQERMEKHFRDFQLGYVKSLKDPEIIKTFLDDITTKYPTHIPVYTTKLMQMSEKKKLTSQDELEEIERLVAKIIELCSPSEILQWIGARQETLDDQTEEQKDLNSKKSYIIQALMTKANVYADCHLNRSTLQIPAGFRNKIKPIEIIESKDSEFSSAAFFAIRETPDSREVVDKKLSRSENTEESDAATDKPNSGTVPLQEDTENFVAHEDGIGEAEKKSDDSGNKIEKDEEDASVEAAKVSREQLDTAYYELLKWISHDDPKILLISAKQAVAHEHFGRALKYLDKYRELIKSKGYPTKEIYKISEEICDILGWVHLCNMHRNLALHENPPLIRPFQSF